MRASDRSGHTGARSVSGEVESIRIAGIERGYHLGGQRCVVRDGREILNLAPGEVRSGMAMTTEHLMH